MCPKTTYVQVHTLAVSEMCCQDYKKQNFTILCPWEFIDNIFMCIFIYKCRHLLIYKCRNKSNIIFFNRSVSFNWVAMIPKAEIFENPGPTHSNLVVIRMSTFHFIASVPHDLRIGQIVYRIHPSHSSNFSAAFPIVLCLQPSAHFHKLSKWAFVQVKHTVECLDIMPPYIWTILVSHLVFSFCSFSRLTLTSCAPREGGLQARDSERRTLLRAADQDSKV